MRRNLALALIIVVALGGVSSAADLSKIWKSPDAGTIGFAGKKVVALVISQDLALRMSAEEALARQLTDLGVQGVAAYRVIPREESEDKDKAKAWFDKIEVEGVVAMRLVKAETVTTYTPATWTTSYYQTWWSYYGSSWGGIWTPASSSRDRVVTVEMAVFSVRRDKLLWAALGQSENPRSMDDFMKQLVTEAVKEMKKAGLTARK